MRSNFDRRVLGDVQLDFVRAYFEKSMGAQGLHGRVGGQAGSAANYVAAPIEAYWWYAVIPGERSTASVTSAKGGL